MNKGIQKPTLDVVGFADVEPVSAGDEAQYFDQSLREAQRAVTRVLASRIAAKGVSIGHWYFLLALWQEEGLTQRDLSGRVGMMEPTTVTALSGMEKQGLVRRVRNSEDRRKVNVYLTDRGRALRDQLLPTAAEVESLALAGFSAEDSAKLRTLLRRVTDNLLAA
ncbi:MAG: MarR family transcriptional regulator [Rhodospirillaceae bacterium]|nr:MarR family transcriptional regulator [Rhodospirillaceae bacterium]